MMPLLNYNCINDVIVRKMFGYYYLIMATNVFSFLFYKWKTLKKFNHLIKLLGENYVDIKYTVYITDCI